MAEYEIAIRGGTVATGFGTARCDVGIRGGRIAALAERIADADRVIEADGLLVLPGGVDTHCHIEQPEANGTVHEESFVSASTSAFAGGTTSAVCFVPQFKGGGIVERFEEYRARAAKGMLDHGFHQIIADPTEEVIEREIPRVVAAGVRSL
jgi:dihydropyrimidinase